MAGMCFTRTQGCWGREAGRIMTPFLLPQWDVNGEKWGKCPGQSPLPAAGV